MNSQSAVNPIAELKPVTMEFMPFWAIPVRYENELIDVRLKNNHVAITFDCIEACVYERLYAACVNGSKARERSFMVENGMVTFWYFRTGGHDNGGVEIKLPASLFVGAFKSAAELCRQSQ